MNPVNDFSWIFIYLALDQTKKLSKKKSLSWTFPIFLHFFLYWIKYVPEFQKFL